MGVQGRVPCRTAFTDACMFLPASTTPFDLSGNSPGVGAPSRGGGQPGERASFRFRLDPSSGVTSYAQLVQAVERECRHRYLRPQNQLPKVREVVSKLLVNPNTVLKAYKEVEDNGLLVDRPGRGTFVAGPRAGRPGQAAHGSAVTPQLELSGASRGRTCSRSLSHSGRCRSPGRVRAGAAPHRWWLGSPPP